MQILVFIKLTHLLHCLLSLYPHWLQCLSIGASVLWSVWREHFANIHNISGALKHITKRNLTEQVYVSVPSINLYNSLAYLTIVKITFNRLLWEILFYLKTCVYTMCISCVLKQFFNALFTNNKLSNSKVFSLCDDVKLLWCRICINFQLGSNLLLYILITKTLKIRLSSI